VGQRNHPSFMLWSDAHQFILVPPLLADLGLERNPNAERGLVVWSLVVISVALLTLRLAMRRGGMLSNMASNRRERMDDDMAHGWPFMRRTLLNVVQLLAGVLVVYALARIAEPRAERPAGWHLVCPPHEASALALHGNILWAGGKEGLSAVDRQSLTVLDIRPLKARDLRGVRALIAEDDALWIGCRQGVFCYRHGQLERVAPRDGKDLGPVTALCRARDGALWIGTREGTWRVDLKAGEWRWFGHSEGLPLPSVDVIYQDRGGALWFGSNDPEAGGIFRSDERDWKFSDRSSGLSSHAVNGLMEDHTGVLWVATGFSTHGGAARFAGDKWLPLADIPGLSGEKIRSMFEDSRHYLWFCSEYNGVAIRRGDGWKRITQREGLPGSEVKDLLEDEYGTLWLATERGLGCLRSLP
jgi:ligand-binding sensor domain-containing protein